MEKQSFDGYLRWKGEAGFACNRLQSAECDQMALRLTNTQQQWKFAQLQKILCQNRFKVPPYTNKPSNFLNCFAKVEKLGIIWSH